MDGRTNPNVQMAGGAAPAGTSTLSIMQTGDTTGYESWPVIQTSDGAKFYEVPGSDGRLVFDPVMTALKHKTVFRPSPKTAIEAKKASEDQQKAAIELQKKQSSPIGQAAAMVGPVGGIIAANYALQHTAPATATGLIQSGPYAGMMSMTDGTILNPVTHQIVGQGTAAVQPVANTLGTTATSTGEAFLGPGVPGAEGVVVDPTIGASGFEVGGIGSAGNYYLPALGAVGAYDVLSHDVGPVRGGLEGAASGAAIGSYFGPPGALVGAGIGGAIGLGKSMFEKPSTKEIQAGRYKAAGVVNPYPEGHDFFEGTGGEQSRDERYLTPDAIRLNPDNWNAAPDYGSWTKDQQDQFLSDLLQNGKVQERKGGIYYDDAYAKSVADRIRGGGAAVAPVVAAPVAPAAPVQAPPIARSPNAVVAPGATVAPMVNTVPMAAIKPALPPRSRTSSPGVALPGVTLTPLEMGQRLANRINARR